MRAMLLSEATGCGARYRESMTDSNRPLGSVVRTTIRPIRAYERRAGLTSRLLAWAYRNVPRTLQRWPSFA
jgi:hypothetical protein